MVQCDISLFLEQLLQIELYFHLQYKFMGCFFSYRWEVELATSVQEGGLVLRALQKQIIRE